MSVDTEHLEAVRSFSRFYTKRIGLLAEGIVDSPYSVSEARLLYELAQRDTSTLGEVARALALDAGYVSRLVHGLQGRGLVKKARSTTDRRRLVLRLSAKGRTTYERLNAGSRAQISAMMRDVHPDKRAEVVSSMGVIERALGEMPSSPVVTYRGHQPGDMGWIVQRHAVLYHESHGWDDTFEAMVAGIVQRFLESFDLQRERSWIAEVDGRRAGAIALTERSKTVGQLRLLFVEPWARGLGIGARLVSECVGQARHVGYDKMILFTVRGLDSARKLYEAEGFELVDQRPQEAWGKTQLAQTWELELR